MIAEVVRWHDSDGDWGRSWYGFPAFGPILDFGLICVIDAAASSKERGGLIAGKSPAPAYIPCKVGGGGEDYVLMVVKIVVVFEMMVLCRDGECGEPKKTKLALSKKAQRAQRRTYVCFDSFQVQTFIPNIE